MNQIEIKLLKSSQPFTCVTILPGHPVKAAAWVRARGVWASPI